MNSVGFLAVSGKNEAGVYVNLRCCASSLDGGCSVQQVGIRMSSKRPTQLDCLRELHTRTATSASLQRKHGKLPHQQPVKEYVNCVSMSVYGLDWQSRRSKSCVVNDGSLSTEVLRIARVPRYEVREANCFVWLNKKRTK